MKKTNNIIKQFLNLKEDYTLDLSKDVKDSQLIVEADNTDETENTDKTDNTESANITTTSEKSSENTEDNISKEKTQKEVNNSTEKSVKDTSFNPEKVPEIYSKMESSKSPVDVALALKDFLDEIEKTSLNALLD